MKKIGSVIASVSRNAGGLYESVRNLSISVDRQGDFDNVVFSLRDKYTDQDKDAWAPLDVRVQPVLGPRSLGYAPGLLEQLCTSDLDVMHSHGIWMYPSSSVYRCAQRRSIPYVVSPHGMLDPWAVAHSRWKKKIAYRWYEGDHLKGAACLHALCESEANAIRSFGLTNPICVIPNGIDLPQDAPASRPSCIAGIPESRKILLYLGRIHPKKGLPSLLRAWAKLHGHDWHLVIAGWDQGHHQKELVALAASLGVVDSVSFVGPQFGEAKRALYLHADAFVLPSFSEGLPMVVLEAWSYGVPVVITPECNLPEGFNADAAVEIHTDPDSVAHGLQTLFSLPKVERLQMGRNGRKLVERQFTWSTIGEQMGAVYWWLLGGPTPDCVRFD